MKKPASRWTKPEKWVLLLAMEYTNAKYIRQNINSKAWRDIFFHFCSGKKNIAPRRITSKWYTVLPRYTRSRYTRSRYTRIQFTSKGKSLLQLGKLEPGKLEPVKISLRVSKIVLKTNNVQFFSRDSRFLHESRGVSLLA